MIQLPQVQNSEDKIHKALNVTAPKRSQRICEQQQEAAELKYPCMKSNFQLNSDACDVFNQEGR